MCQNVSNSLRAKLRDITLATQHAFDYTKWKTVSKGLGIGLELNSRGVHRKLKSVTMGVGSREGARLPGFSCMMLIRQREAYGAIFRSCFFRCTPYPLEKFLPTPLSETLTIAVGFH